MINGKIPKVLYFMDRTKLAEDIVLPANNKEYLIIPPTQSGIGYKWPKHSEVKDFIDVHLTEHNYKVLVDEFTHVGSKEWRDHLKSLKIRSYSFMKFILLIALISLGVAFVAFMYITHANKKFQYADYVFYGACGLSVFSLFFTFMTNFILCTKLKKFVPFDKKLIAKMNQVSTALNAQFMVENGL